MSDSPDYVGDATVPDEPTLLAAGAPPLETPAVEPPVAPVAPVTAEPRRRRGLRQVLVAGLAGGVVGALVAAGMYTVFDDQATTRASGPAATDVIVRLRPDPVEW